MATTEREALIAALPRALMDAARRDALTDADRVAIGQAIVVVQDAHRAALAARPVEQQAAPDGVVAWQVRRIDGDGGPLTNWESCTQDLYEATLATGRYGGYENGPPCEVRALVDARAAQPAAQASAFNPAVPTNDRLRAIARQARDRSGPSDTTLPDEYVLEGWREAEKYHGIAATPPAPTEPAPQAGAAEFDCLPAILGDLRHSARVDGYTEDQRGFMEAMAVRLETRINAMSGPLPAPAAHPTEQPSQDAEVLAKIRTAITGYYLALDGRQNGGIAANNALGAIQEVMGMSWFQGAAARAAQAQGESKGGADVG